jgi:hypothetical protein
MKPFVVLLLAVMALGCTDTGVDIEQRAVAFNFPVPTLESPEQV